MMRALAILTLALAASCAGCQSGDVVGESDTAEFRSALVECNATRTYCGCTTYASPGAEALCRTRLASSCGGYVITCHDALDEMFCSCTLTAPRPRGPTGAAGSAPPVTP